MSYHRYGRLFLSRIDRLLRGRAPRNDAEGKEMTKAKTINIDDAIGSLIREREMIDESIAALLRLKEVRGGRRGRPPAWMTKARALLGEGKERKLPLAG